MKTLLFSTVAVALISTTVFATLLLLPSDDTNMAENQDYSTLKTQLVSLEQANDTNANQIKTIYKNQDELKTILLSLIDKLESESSEETVTLEQIEPLDTAQPITSGVNEIDQRIQHLKDNLLTQETDTAFSTEVQQVVTNSLQENAIEGSELAIATCSTAMCQLEFNHSDNEKLNQFMEELPSIIPWDHDGFVQINDDDPMAKRTVAIITREGQAFPE